MRQLTYSTGPEQMGIHIRAFKATTRSKDFTFGKPFVDYHKLYNIVLILCIFLLCRFLLLFIYYFYHLFTQKNKKKQCRYEYSREEAREAHG
jgi:cbb3-type cytochrome oxidase subunit 3